MAIDQLTPLLLSIVICLTLPSFQGIFTGHRNAELVGPVQTTVASALGISGAGLALNNLTSGAGCIVILLGVFSAPIVSHYSQNPLIRIAASFFVFLLYLRFGDNTFT